MNVFRIVVGFGVLAGILLFSYHLYKDTVSNYGRVEGDKLAIYKIKAGKAHGFNRGMIGRQ